MTGVVPKLRTAQDSTSGKKTSERRGGDLPARLRFSAHRGVTLVELMISMLILAIVCVAWLEIIGIQSARKEARRREAVERLAGMMDAFMYIYKARVEARTGDILQKSGYAMVKNGSELHFVPDESKSVVYPMFEENVSSIGYQLLVGASSDSDLPSHVKEMLKKMQNWGEGNTLWLIGLLYDSNGNVNDVGVGRSFFTLPIYLGLQL